MSPPRRPKGEFRRAQPEGTPVNQPQLPTDDGPWTRPQPARQGPNRGAGGYYRSADRELDGKLLRGVPLHSAEDAAVAAVRMAYQIADGQIDRGLRIARSLRRAGRRAGVEPAAAVDATEHLLSKTLLAALQWLESAADTDEHPLRRLASAEYRWLGALLGLHPGGHKSQAAARRERDGERDGGSAQAMPPTPAATTAASPSQIAPAVELAVINTAEPRMRRPVRAARLQLAAGRGHAPVSPSALYFHHAEAGAADAALEGRLQWPESGAAGLEVQAVVGLRSGLWSAGVFDERGVQLGVVTLEL